jgi:predicted 3-demethylubiquinone-9 3-methyltransferase (glyoxalase superfamily)
MFFGKRQKKRIMQKTSTFFLFVGEQCGKAEEAMRFYTSLFKNAEVKALTRYKKGEPGGPEGGLKLGVFVLAGQQYMISDSDGPHKFSFTPAVSLFVNCDDEMEMTDLIKQLTENGSVLMPAGNYGFSRQFAWVSDRYGVSWQLNLA